MSFDLRSSWQSRLLCSAVTSTIIYTFMGCGNSDGLPRVAVNGEVTVDGAPLASGVISFVPVGSGPATGGAIDKGAFKIAEEKGPVPGKYKVRVTTQAGKPLGPEVADGSSAPEMHESEVEIKDGANELKLDL